MSNSGLYPAIRFARHYDTTGETLYDRLTGVSLCILEIYHIGSDFSFHIFSAMTKGKVGEWRGRALVKGFAVKGAAAIG